MKTTTAVAFIVVFATITVVKTMNIQQGNDNAPLLAEGEVDPGPVVVDPPPKAAGPVEIIGTDEDLAEGVVWNKQFTFIMPERSPSTAQFCFHQEVQQGQMVALQYLVLNTDPNNGRPLRIFSSFYGNAGFISTSGAVEKHKYKKTEITNGDGTLKWCFQP